MVRFMAQSYDRGRRAAFGRIGSGIPDTSRGNQSLKGIGPPVELLSVEM
jgi:hypothetical protein